MKTALKPALVAVAVSALALTAYWANGDDETDRTAMRMLVELEGIELREYTDVAGNRTCGVGHLAVNGERCPTNLREAMQMLAVDHRKSSGVYSPVRTRVECQSASGTPGVRVQCRVRRVVALDGAKAT